MANFDFVQQKASSAITGTSGTVTLDATPTVGNTLIAKVVNADVTTISSPKVVGFRPVEMLLSANGTAVIYYRQVKAGDTAVITITQGTASAMSVNVCEFVGVMVPHRSVPSVDSNTSVTSRSTGTTPATTTAAGLAVGVVGVRNVTATAASWTNSFTDRTAAFAGSGSTGRTCLSADLLTASATTYESTVSWSSVSERAYGCIAVFIIGTAQTDGAYITAVKADTPISLYRFNGDLVGVLPDEMNANHCRLTTTGITVFQTGPTTVETNNFAMLFDGAAGFADTKSTQTTLIDQVAVYSGDVSIEVWVKTADQTQGTVGDPGPALTSKNTDVAGTFAAPGMLNNDGLWYAHYRNDAIVGESYAFGTLSVPLSTWELFWITFSASGMKAYNVVAGTVTQQGVAQTDVTVGAFGMHRFAHSQGSGVFTNIQLANCAIWHSVLTTVQMQAHYDAAFPPAPNLAAGGPSTSVKSPHHRTVRGRMSKR